MFPVLLNLGATLLKTAVSLYYQFLVQDGGKKMRKSATVSCSGGDFEDAAYESILEGVYEYMGFYGSEAGAEDCANLLMMRHREDLASMARVAQDDADDEAEAAAIDGIEMDEGEYIEIIVDAGYDAGGEIIYGYYDETVVLDFWNNYL